MLLCDPFYFTHRVKLMNEKRQIKKNTKEMKAKEGVKNIVGSVAFGFFNTTKYLLDKFFYQINIDIILCVNYLMSLDGRKK